VRALLCQDDAATTDTVSQALIIGLPECSLEATDSAKQCLTLFNKILPDIVILDTHVKDMDVWQLVKYIHAHSDVPIVMLSYTKDEAQVVKALEMGVVAYLFKPLRQMEFTAYIRRILRDRPSRFPVGDAKLRS
jgi:DNA-binding response OmpR family regulator